MEKVLDWVNLLRVRQWYKNLVVFLAIFFVGHLLNLYELWMAFLGFVSLCLVSSANYIVNDLVDLKKDRLHPEKKKRPLAAARIGRGWAVVVAMVLFSISIRLALSLHQDFFYSVLGLLVITQVYTFYLKRIIFADILTISTLFVVRAISGAHVIQVKISPWLVLCPFFLSLFLSIGKRHADLLLLKEKAVATREVLRDYNHGLTNSLMIISTTLLTISYALYCFLSKHQNLLYTLPFALFVIFRFFFLVNRGSEIARHAERVFWDRQMTIGILLWVVITGLLIYG